MRQDTPSSSQCAVSFLWQNTPTFSADKIFAYFVFWWPQKCSRALHGSGYSDRAQCAAPAAISAEWGLPPGLRRRSWEIWQGPRHVHLGQLDSEGMPIFHDNKHRNSMRLVTGCPGETLSTKRSKRPCWCTRPWPIITWLHATRGMLIHLYKPITLSATDFLVNRPKLCASWSYLKRLKMSSTSI